MLDPRLSHVVAVARNGSFTAAAKVAGVTQSALTKSIADLERQLGYLLFHRTSRGVLLTQAGRDFVDRAARLLDDARDLLKSSPGREDPFAGVLRIGVCPASLEWCLINASANLLSRHPSIRFEISGSSFERVVQQLRGGVVDVAVGFDAAFREWPDLRREPLVALQSTLFVRKGHPLLEKRTPPDFADLAKYDFVSPSDSRPYGAIIRNLYENEGIEWRKHLHVIDNFAIVRRIVAKSDAIGVVAISHATSRAFEKQYVTLSHLEPFPSSPLCCAVRARWEAPRAVRAFINAMRSDLILAKSHD